MNKIIKIFLLCICLFAKQSNTTAFQKILLACGAIPAFHIAKFIHFYIMGEIKVNRANKNVKKLQHISGKIINRSKEHFDFENERIKLTNKLEYSKVLKSLDAFNYCIETAIKQKIASASQTTFNYCNEYGLESLKQSETKR